MRDNYIVPNEYNEKNIFLNCCRENTFLSICNAMSTENRR